MKRIVRFLLAYKLFVFAVFGLISALVLEFFKLHTLANWVLATVSIIEVLPLLYGMFQDFRAGKYGVDILAATAIIVSVVLHQYWAAIIIVIMLTGGKSLEDFAASRARSELKALLKRAPQTAHVFSKKKIIDVKASEVKIHEKIVIKPGEVVPVDAVILEGNGTFDESSLTGESLPVVKQEGDQVLSGSVNMDGAILAKTLHPASESQYQQIIRMVRSASESQAPFVRLADRYSIPFTLAAYSIGMAAWFLSHQPIRFLEVIVVATPCPLILATPIALIAGMSRASRDGIIIKTGTALEQLAQAKTFIFDKTGTLTQGIPDTDEVIAFKPFDQETVLTYSASLEQNSNHVLSRAIVAEAAVKKIKLLKAKHIKELAGLGVAAHIANKEIVVGRYELLEMQDVSIPAGLKPNSISKTATYVAIDGVLAGYITFKDNVRPETKSTLKKLHQLGILSTLMITGDNRTTAQKVAKELGISDIKANALPGDKLHTLETISIRPVAFVGDGVNDAPVLTAADVGIALGARGSTAASESADVVIMKDDFSYVARAVAIAQRSFFIAKQSILVGIGLSTVLMVIFATGRFLPLYGALIQEVVDVAVIFNALRAHSNKYNH